MISGGELAGCVALVTGSAHRIGRAIALALAEGGCRVAVHALTSRTAAAETVAEIERRGGEAAPFFADLTDPDAVAALMEAVDARFGRLDILVNNASRRTTLRLEELTLADWRSVLQSNLEAAFLCSQAALPRLARQGGSIVNIGGQVAHTGGIGRAPVAAAKAGLVGLTRALAAELAPQGIRVNCVAPGLVETGGRVDPAPSRIPLARLGTTGEVAGTVRFLCGPAGAYITGQTLHVNGGAHYG